MLFLTDQRRLSSRDRFIVPIQVGDERCADMMSSHLNIMQSMIKGSIHIAISQNNAPEGWCSENVGPAVIVSIPADGEADSAAETKNLEKQLTVARRNQKKIEKRLSQPGYADAVSEAAKAKDQEKVGLIPRPSPS